MRASGATPMNPSVGARPAGDDRCGERSVRIAVGHPVAALVDEIAAGLRRHPRRTVHSGVDDGDSYPGAGCELLRLIDPQVVAGPRLVGEVRIRERRGGRADAALFRRLVRARLVGWHRGRVDRRRLDRCGGGSAKQCQYQRHQQHTNAVHVYEPPSSIAQPALCWYAHSKARAAPWTAYLLTSGPSANLHQTSLRVRAQGSAHGSVAVRPTLWPWPAKQSTTSCPGSTPSSRAVV